MDDIRLLAHNQKEQKEIQHCLKDGILCTILALGCCYAIITLGKVLLPFAALVAIILIPALIYSVLNAFFQITFAALKTITFLLRD